MSDNRHTRLPKTIVTLYRNHWRLFWCIMLPVALVAISLDIGQHFFQLMPSLETHIDGMPGGRDYTVASNVNTVRGIEPTIVETPTDRPTSPGSSWKAIYQLYPVLSFETANTEGVTWRWDPYFLIFDYSPLILLLLTFCPLSLAVARLGRGAEGSDTAREMWRQTGRKGLRVFAAAVLFILIVDVGSYLYILVSWLLSFWGSGFFVEFNFIPIIVFHIYFMVTLGLYNACLMLEERSIFGVFRRSYLLVRGARWRFVGIYLLTGWIASVLASVLFGAALLIGSVFSPELALVRGALLPGQFLALFIGADLEVVLPHILNTPATVAILMIRGLIITFLVPIWAILTTELYFRRVSVKEAV